MTSHTRGEAWAATSSLFSPETNGKRAASTGAVTGRTGSRGGSGSPVTTSPASGPPSLAGDLTYRI